MANNRGRIALIGRIGSGKTTLVQCLSNEFLKYQKTQQVTYSPHFLDTPGEFVELPCFRPQAINVTCDAGLIILVNSATDCQNSVPPQFIRTYNRPVLGVITKIDDKNSNLKRSYRYLEYAGVKKSEIIPVSAFSGDGIELLKKQIDNIVEFG
ncbi:EutP/PduV family microcompartment system protein [Eubacteriaceae bacterium ES3]|nr:EutP/PduV family microcompartment system protein [Eubacteriaceae bacterium ES3]